MRAILCLVLLMVCPLPPAAAAMEEARAKITPWSGYWWPSRRGDLVRGYGDDPLSPLAKHDLVTGARAEDWERRHHFDPDLPKWHGHCNGWAAATITEPEPRVPVTYGGVRFRVGDIKGLLAVAHYGDRALVYGERYTGERSDIEDIAPDRLWQVLRRYLGERGVPLLMDMEAGPEVWTYPIYGYQVHYDDEGRDGRRRECELVLNGTDVIPSTMSPDQLGLRSLRRTYQFSVRMEGRNPVPGTGQWTGESRRRHPDYAWYPQERGQENPELVYSLVRKLTELSAGSTEPESLPGSTDWFVRGIRETPLARAFRLHRAVLPR